MTSELRRPGSAAAVLFLALWTTACVPSASTELRMPEGTPVVIISVDTLRSDHLAAYGYGVVETPAIDRLRREGILFERAYTHVPLTLPAHTSLLTGLLPPTHGVRDNLGYTVSASTTMLQQTLKEAGYATGAAVSAFVLRRATGLAAGFDFYEDRVEFGHGVAAQEPQRPGLETFQAVRPWLRSVADRPFFLFFHIFEPHAPYEPPPQFGARYSSPYDGEVAAADDVVGRLLVELGELGVYEKALIVFLSDHGEGLGDHGEAEHGLFLYRSTLQVPLIVKLPRSERAGETVDSPVQLIDVYPTVVSALGIPPADALQGRPLLAEEGRENRDNPVYAETYYPRLHFGWSELAGLIVGRYHYVDAPQPELYDLLADPEETVNLVTTEAAIESELRSALRAYDGELAAPSSVDAETRRRLEALGYVGGTSTNEGMSLPDPKSRVGTLAEISRAHLLLNDGEFAAAASLLQAIVEESPRIEDAWEHLALAQIGLGQLEAAAITYQRALEEIPRSERLALRAAQLFEHLGRLDDAYVYASVAIPYDAAAAHVVLAQIALRRGDLEDAEVEARQALSDGDRRPEARLILADSFIGRGDPQAAIDLLVQTLDEGIRAEAVCAKLAITYLWIGELDKAEQVLRGFEDTNDLGLLLAFGKLAISRQSWSQARNWFERALYVDPNNPTVKINLGLIAMTQGHLSEAKKMLEDAVAANPGSFEGWNTMGAVCARLGDALGAITAWEQAYEINPDVDGVLFNLGLAHAQAGHTSRAIGYFEAFAARSDAGPQRDQALAMAQRLRLRTSERR